MAELSGLRIAMIIQSYLPRLGGAEKQLATVCRKLRQRGLEPTIITRRYPGMRAFEVIDQTPVYRVPTPQPKSLAAFCYILFGLRKIKQIQPQVVHAHELLSPTDMAVLGKKLWRIPVAVKVLRGGKLGDLYKLNHRASGRARIRRMKNYVDVFLAISREISEELMQEGIAAQRCRFIPNGVDVDVYKPLPEKERVQLRQLMQLPEGFLCMYSGRLAPEKGLLTLLEAWQIFLKSNSKANLLILGSGEMEAELRSKAGKNVTFVGHVADPKPFLQACDAFILPSATEGLSNAMLEAMACGLAVVATRVGAAPELIKDQVSGLLVNPGNVAEITEALGLLASHPADCKRFGQKSSQKVAQDYSLDNTVERLIALYGELAEVAL